MPKSHGDVKLCRHYGDRLSGILNGALGTVSGDAGCLRGPLERWRRDRVLNGTFGALVERQGA